MQWRTEHEVSLHVVKPLPLLLLAEAGRADDRHRTHVKNDVDEVGCRQNQRSWVLDPVRRGMTWNQSWEVKTADHGSHATAVLGTCINIHWRQTPHLGQPNTAMSWLLNDKATKTSAAKARTSATPVKIQMIIPAFPSLAVNETMKHRY